MMEVVNVMLLATPWLLALVLVFLVIVMDMPKDKYGYGETSSQRSDEQSGSDTEEKFRRMERSIRFNEQVQDFERRLKERRGPWLGYDPWYEGDIR